MKKSVSPTLAEQVKADADAREKACLEDVQACLVRHNCAIRVIPDIIIDGKAAGILFTANSITVSKK